MALTIIPDPGRGRFPPTGRGKVRAVGQTEGTARRADGEME